MGTDSTREQFNQVLTRLTEARDGYNKCLTDVPAEVAVRGAEWAITDLLGHVNGDYYRTLFTRLTTEDNPQLGGAAFDLSRFWDRTVERTMANIDSAIEQAKGLTDDQLNRVGQLRGADYSVIDALNGWAAHFEEHLTQLRDEIRPREGLAQV